MTETTDTQAPSISPSAATDGSEEFREIIAFTESRCENKDQVIGYLAAEILSLRDLAREMLEMIEEYHACDWEPEEPFTPDIEELRARICAQNTTLTRSMGADDVDHG